MRAIQHVFRRGDTYWWRRRVTKSSGERVRQPIAVSLRTREPATARMLLPSSIESTAAFSRVSRSAFSLATLRLSRAIPCCSDCKQRGLCQRRDEIARDQELSLMHLTSTSALIHCSPIDVLNFQAVNSNSINPPLE